MDRYGEERVKKHVERGGCSGIPCTEKIKSYKMGVIDDLPFLRNIRASD